MSVDICAKALFLLLGNIAKGTAPIKNSTPGTTNRGELIMKKRKNCTKPVTYGFLCMGKQSWGWGIHVSLLYRYRDDEEFLT
tara:strand:- start:1607 stop:1852 length:246 start_codon:yes stop_codon:yes gene_type:complete